MMGLSLEVNRLDWWNILEELTPRQLNVWQAYTSLEPIGEDRADLRAAVNTSAILRALGDKEDRTETLARYLKIHEQDAAAAASPAKAAGFLKRLFKRG